MNELLKKISLIFLLYVDCFRVSCGDTIHYTNSPRHLGVSENYTTYKLEVPGNEPITVIEANRGPVNLNQGIRGVQQRDWIENAQILHKRKNSKTEMLDRVDMKDNNQSPAELFQPKKTVYSPELLKKFIQDYAERIHNFQSEEGDVEKHQEHNIPNYDRHNDYVTINKMDENEDDNREEKYKNFGVSWNNDRNEYHDRNRHTGWVSLEPIPWSTTKISKWQNNKYSNRPHPGTQHNSNYASSSPWINDEDDYDYVESQDDGHFQSYRPQHQSKPWSKRPRPPTYDYSGSNKGSLQPSHKPWNDRPYSSDIVTDNRPPDFPKFPSFQKQPSNYDKYFGDRNSDRLHSNHPNSYPSQGNGEWILISTTKGYHYPRKGQRAMTASESNNVLAQEPMKFSMDTNTHQNTFYDRIQLDPAASTHIQEQESIGADETSTVMTKKKILRAIPVIGSKNKYDKNAVLAAVAAGMVPATVAMLAPMVLG
ncbi:hypothetical protein DMENIID0001_003860 [Sergentomyia squamirostris]